MKGRVSSLVWSKSWSLPWLTDKNHEKPQPKQSAFQLRFEASTSQTQVRSTTDLFCTSNTTVVTTIIGLFRFLLIGLAKYIYFELGGSKHIWNSNLSYFRHAYYSHAPHHEDIGTISHNRPLPIKCQIHAPTYDIHCTICTCTACCNETDRHSSCKPNTDVATTSYATTILKQLQWPWSHRTKYLRILHQTATRFLSYSFVSTMFIISQTGCTLKSRSQSQDTLNHVLLVDFPSWIDKNNLDLHHHVSCVCLRSFQPRRSWL